MSSPIYDSEIFSLEYFQSADVSRITLKPEFKIEQWVAVDAAFQTKLKIGRLIWELNLRQIDLLDFQFYGFIIGMNTMISSRNGVLSVYVETNSGLARKSRKTRLNLILEMIELAPDEKLPKPDKSGNPRPAQLRPPADETSDV
jgi:hypothetical protein